MSLVGHKRQRTGPSSDALPLKRRRLSSRIGSSVGFDWGPRDVHFEDIESDEETAAPSTSSFRPSHDVSRSPDVPPPRFPGAISERTQRRSRISQDHVDDLVSARELDVVSDDVIPTTAADFDRLLFSSPSSSYLWIQYVAFHLSMGEIDVARRTIRKALKKIPADCISDRLNVFKTLLNLENRYGTDSTRQQALEFSIRHCGKRKEIRIHQARLLEQNDEQDEADSFFRKILRKYKQSKKCFVEYAAYLVRRRQFQGVFRLIERILQQFVVRRAVPAIVKIAILFYRAEELVEGHRVFESLLQRYPKRTDVWTTFIQMERNKERFGEARQLYQRLLTLPMSQSKKKRYFKQFYAFEEAHGSERELNEVKKMAKEFVRSLA